MAYAESYNLNLDVDYVLALFQNAVDFECKGTQLECWTDIIMDWYEYQLDNNEFDTWTLDIPNLVHSDIIVSKMICVSVHNPLFNEVDTLYQENGIGYVGDQSDNIARICYQSRDNDGNVCYLCQCEE